MTLEGMANNWINILTQDCSFNKDCFMAAMDTVIKDPQFISKSILRADITSDITQNNIRTIKRCLLPRMNKTDKPLYQDLYLYSSDSESRMDQFPIFPNAEKNPNDLPFFYPKIQALSYVYQCASADSEFSTISIQIIPFENLAPDEKLILIINKIAAKILKFANGYRDGYVKRVHHDQIVEKTKYQDKYQIMKDKYIHWVSKWTEGTDPSKHVFEDIAIATWLICIWEMEQNEMGLCKKQSFVDVGCGNGLLVEILTQEGYYGYGIDISKRKLWSEFNQTTDLRVGVIYPNEQLYDTDWIIGNHADELTLWIPIISARSSFNCKFVVIPCCFHQLSGERFVDFHPLMGRYETYINAVEDMTRSCGYIPEKESLRIPSTKNVAIIGRHRSINRDDNNDLLESIDCITSRVRFVPRKSDKEKGELLREKSARKAIFVQSEADLEANLEFLSEFDVMT